VSWFSARLFTWIQGAAFYTDVHAEAVRLLPRGDGRRWLDVGCGPGLVARLASERGYDALGIDRDPAMVRAARDLTQNERCRFEVGELGRGVAERHSAHVVSAASLLIVLPDPRAGLVELWDCVSPGGTLLVVETTEQMTPERARSVAPHTRPGRRAALSLWARARSGRALDPRLFDTIDARARGDHALLDGLVRAWTFEKQGQPARADRPS
jgi:SAM-dependent methyltransferase